MVPNWKDHCPNMMQFPDPTQYREAVQVLLDANTCFFSETDDGFLHTTDRGIEALLAFDGWEI